MAVQLSASYLRRSFQLVSRLEPHQMSQEEAFDRAGNIIYEWARLKFSKIFRFMPKKKETFDDKRDGNEMGVIFKPDEDIFILRCTHPDKQIPGRLWITDVELKRDGQTYILAVRLSVSSLQACTEDVPFSCPGFVKSIADCIGLSDVLPVTKDVHLLSTNADVDEFVAFLENNERRMPVILLTPCVIVEDGPCNGYMMDAAQMSKDLFGVAHVFQTTQEANRYLTNCIGRQWSAFDGTVRTYYPRLSFENSDCYQHPLLTRQSIYLRSVSPSDDPDLCMHEIEGYVQNYVLAQHIQWDEIGIDFYLITYQNALREQRASSSQSRKDLIASYEDQLEQLQKQSDENLSLADSYANDYEKLREEYDQQRQLIAQLKVQVASLRYQLEEATGEPTDQNVPIDGNYIDIGDWIATYYPDKLKLLSRAARSLKTACYENTSLVFECLKLLATRYYDYRMGTISYEEFTAACKAIDPGLEERGAITDVAAGMQGDEYFVQYQGKRRKLERHLAKGNSKDRRYCLRIYFFWDDQDEIIVIGDLPHHLDTVAT